MKNNSSNLSDSKAFPTGGGGKGLSKEKKIQYATALILLFGSFILTVAGFIVPPTGEISSSVLYFFAQCLFFTGAVFGLNLMVKNNVEHFFRKHQQDVTEINQSPSNDEGIDDNAKD